MTRFDDHDDRREARYGQRGVRVLEDDDYFDDPGWDDDELDLGRSGGARAARIGIVLLVLLVVLALGYVFGRGWFDRQLDPEGPPGEEVSVVIEPGSTTAQIADQLEAQGVVPNSTFFRYYVDWKGEGNFQAGTYSIQLSSSAAEAMAKLDAGPVPIESTTFTVPEGRWVSEMLPIIAEQVPQVTAEELQAVLDSGQVTPAYRPEGVTSWEGLLFPSTYDVAEDATALDVITLMNAEFQRVTAEVGYGGTELYGGRSAYELIIIASMIEAEAKADGDRAKIAQVIYNRLEQGMSLDIDATCIYGAGDRQVQLTSELMISGVGEYACRNYSDLPPTPIAAPSRAALEAALQPEDGPWLYYVVADAEGHHAFAVTLEEHEVNKEAAREAGLLG